MKGWTVSLAAPDLNIFMSGNDYVLDVMSYLELPRDFPAARPNFIVSADPSAAKERFQNKIREHKRSNGESEK